MPGVTIRVRDLHVVYELHENRRSAIRDRLVARRGSGRSEIHAVKGVSFDVFEGDSVGIVGSNGSGKSTMLSAIAGMLPPASGEILVLDEPKLLGVGACSSPPPPGGATSDWVPRARAHRRRGRRADRRDRRVLRPRRGPRPTAANVLVGDRARLHFAVATAVEPRILFIDEALGVGDRRFRRKAQRRLREIVSAAGTTMLVTHATNEIRAQCNRALWLEQGVLRADGGVDEVVDAYEAYMA